LKTHANEHNGDDSLEGKSRTNIVKDKKGDWVIVCDNILGRWRKLSATDCSVHGASDVRQTAVRTALVPEPSAFEFEMDVEKLNRNKSPGTDQIPAELITAGGRTVRSEIH